MVAWGSGSHGGEREFDDESWSGKEKVKMVGCH